MTEGTLRERERDKQDVFEQKHGVASQFEEGSWAHNAMGDVYQSLEMVASRGTMHW